MKLWKAIVKGSKKRPQCFGNFFLDNGSCAVGAAIEGCFGYIPSSLDPDDICKKFEIMSSDPRLTGRAICPDCGTNVLYTGFGMIPHLNDVHMWSREATAEYIKTFEDNITREKWEKRNQKHKVVQAVPARIEFGVKELVS